MRSPSAAFYCRGIAACSLCLLWFGAAGAQAPPKTEPTDPKPDKYRIKVSGSAFGDAKDDKTPAPMRWVDRGDVVEDRKTGLLWQKDGKSSGKMNFYEAKAYAKKLKLGGMTGWRVPTQEELKGIFPATERPFVNSGYTELPCCKGAPEFRSYWTSELDTRKDDYAYVYHWYHKGGANNCFASRNRVYVRCVHDPLMPSAE